MRKLFVMFFVLLLAGCKSDGPEPGSTPPVKVDEVLFVYLGMDNNLARYGYGNIEAIKEGLQNERVHNGKVVVFCDFPGINSKLIELKLNKNNVSEEIVLLQYDSNLDSSDPSVMSSVFSNLKAVAPADHYSMIIGSHGLGWASNTVLNRSRKMDMHPSRVVIENAGKYMNTEDLAATIPAGMFDAILFDACFMGNVETIYPFRNKTNIMVGSQSETWVEGFPYSKIMSLLLNGSKTYKDRMKGLVDKYTEHYATFTDAANWKPGGNLAVYDCSKLDALCDVTSRIIDQSSPNLWTGMNDIQYYDRYTTKLFYDMRHAVSKLVSASDPLWIEFDQALSNVVVHAKTNTVVYDVIMGSFCGLTMYVPYSTAIKQNNNYKQTSWYLQTYKNSPLN